MELIIRENNPILKIRDRELNGLDTNKYLSKSFESNLLIFSNDEEEDSSLEYELFELIKNLKKDDFVDRRIQFAIYNISSGKKPDPLDKIPYPFWALVVGIKKENFFIRFESLHDREEFLDEDELDRGWTKKFYYEHFERVLRNETKATILFDHDDSSLSASMEVLSDELTIDLALKDCIAQVKNLIRRVELSMAGVDGFFDAISIWNSNKNKKSEKYWQKLLKKNSWILSLALSEPMVIFEKEAFLGGKGVGFPFLGHL